MVFKFIKELLGYDTSPKHATNRVAAPVSAPASSASTSAASVSTASTAAAKPAKAKKAPAKKAGTAGKSVKKTKRK